MKDILERRIVLENKLSKLKHGYDHTTEGRRRLYRDSREILKEIRNLDKILELQRAKLGGLIHHVFTEISMLARSGKSEQVAELVAVFRQLPVQMYDSHGFEWRSVVEKIHRYEKQYHTHDYPGRQDYSALLNEIPKSYGAEETT
jgi:hypothetical protein